MSVEVPKFGSEPQAEQEPRGHLLEIQGLKKHEIAYNPARPLRTLHPRTGLLTELLPIRVESTDSAFQSTKESQGVYDSHIKFAQRVGSNGTWKIVDLEEWKLTKTDEKLNLEDPSVTVINDEIVLSGVRATLSGNNNLEITTEVYAGRSPQELEQVAVIYGKDNRFCQLPDGRILFAFRPQGQEAGLGRMAFTIIKDIRNLRRSRLHNVPILVNQMPAQYWGGANELQVVYANGHAEVGVLGHIATRDERGTRHYASIVFTILNADSVDREIPVTTPIKIIARAYDLPETGAKAPDLTDVAFPGALIINPNGRADLLLGKNDWRIGVVEVDDPFAR